VSNGGPSEIIKKTYTINTGHTYRLTFTLTGVSPTALALTVYDVTTSQTGLTLTGTNSFASLQSS
jgi:hypothetical protein